MSLIPVLRIMFAVALLLDGSGGGDSVALPNQDDEIVLGMSTALTGPAAQLGINVRDGVNAALHEANSKGGVKGRKLRLIALDDGYEPERTVPNMHALINRHNVLAVVGNVGTPTAIAAIPIAQKNKTLFFGAFTGAGVLRKTPPDRYVINYRASYPEETGAMVDALIDEAQIDVDEIGFFTQRDAYGDAGYIGGIAAMKRHGLEDDLWVVHGRYDRNTIAVENGLADIIGSRHPVKAVIVVGVYKPAAQFIRIAKEHDFDPMFLGVSFVGADALQHELGEKSDGVIITQVVPHFEGAAAAAVAYREALAAYQKELVPNNVSFEGYVVGTILLRALADIEGPLTRESIVDALEALGEFDIGLGVPLRLDKKNHQACHTVWPVVIRGDHLVPLNWQELRTQRPRN